MAFPATYDFNYYRGDTYSFTIRPKQANNATYPLDNFTAKFVVSESRGAAGIASAVICHTSLDTVSDTLTCKIRPADGIQLDPTKVYYYDVQITGSGSNLGDVYTLLTGKITVQDDISDTVAVP